MLQLWERVRVSETCFDSQTQAMLLSLLKLCVLLQVSVREFYLEELVKQEGEPVGEHLLSDWLGPDREVKKEGSGWEGGKKKKKKEPAAECKPLHDTPTPSATIWSQRNISSVDEKVFKSCSHSRENAGYHQSSRG